MANERLATFVDKHRLLIAAARDPRLTRAAVGVLSVIVDSAFGDKDWSCPGHEKIAGLAGVSARTSMRSVAELESLGYIRVHREGRNNWYELLLDAASISVPTSDIIVTCPASTSDTPVTDCAVIATTGDSHVTNSVATGDEDVTNQVGQDAAGTTGDNSSTKGDNPVIEQVTSPAQTSDTPVTLISSLNSSLKLLTQTTAHECAETSEGSRVSDGSQEQARKYLDDVKGMTYEITPEVMEKARDQYEQLRDKHGQEHPLVKGFLAHRPYLTEAA